MKFIKFAHNSINKNYIYRISTFDMCYEDKNQQLHDSYYIELYIDYNVISPKLESNRFDESFSSKDERDDRYNQLQTELNFI